MAQPRRAAPPFSDPRALPILSTEHWSLLAGRSLVYNEAFSRAGMFLTFLSASLIALGLMSGAMGFSSEFLTITVLILALDLFIGLATMGRVSTATDEDIRYLQGMNRIRHAYHEAVRGLEPYFISGQYDDVAGIFGVSSADVEFRSRRSIIHGFTTVVGMVGVINAALAGVLVATIVLLVGSGHRGGRRRRRHVHDRAADRGLLADPRHGVDGRGARGQLPHARERQSPARQG